MFQVSRGVTMTRRKRPPEGRSFAVATFRDPGAWLQGFLNYLDAECGMSPNTLAAYRRDLERFFTWNRDVARAGVHDIGVPTITAFLEYLQSLNLAASSIGRGLVAIRMFFRFLMLEGIVAESTVDLVSSPKLWERLPRVLSPEMVDALLVAPQGPLDRYYRRDRAILAVMYATGCRVSEVVDLQLSDIALEENYCRCTGKGNKQRMVSLNPVAVDAIRKYLEAERPAMVLVAGSDRGNLFLSRSGKRINRESVWAMIQRYARRVGCGAEVSPHTLRHSFATHLLAGGADIRALQEMLGHSSIRTTQVYTHVEHSRLKAVHKQCHPRG
jgi:integrase/recombinase XerD